jgi:hypothetical protein
MTAGGRLAAGFIAGGVMMLIVHPRSRPIMAYAFQPDNVRSVLSTNPLSNEPLEFFPPPAEMSGQKRYLAAFRIVRRLLSGWVKPDERDLSIVESFIENSAIQEPDNAYWPQLLAGMDGYIGNKAAGLRAWKSATERGRWETGEGEALQLLWRQMERAEGIRLAWQGVFALDHSSKGPSNFIVTNVNEFAYVDVDARFASLTNAAVILDSSRSFASASAAIALAEKAVFGRINPIDSLGQRRYEEVKSEFPRQVEKLLGADAAVRAIKELQTVESWQAFYRSGAPNARSATARLEVESLLTSSLPSSLLMASLILLFAGLSGVLIAHGLGSILNPDKRIISTAGVATAVAVYLKSGAILLGLWVLTITAILCIPQLVARDVAIPWQRRERNSAILVAGLGMILLTVYFLLKSTPAKYLLSQSIEPSVLGAVSFLILSLSIPVAAVWARVRRVSIFRAVGETLKLIGLSGALIGLAFTLVAAPASLWRDAANRKLLDSWIRNEPATFRPDAPQ